MAPTAAIKLVVISMLVLTMGNKLMMAQASLHHLQYADAGDVKPAAAARRLLAERELPLKTNLRDGGVGRHGHNGTTSFVKQCGCPPICSC